MVMVNWTAVLFVMLVMAYFAALSFLENQHSKRAYISNDEFLASLAIVRKCSVYDLFIHSAGEWRFSSSKVDSDFKNYVKTGHIPHYVVNYVKQNIRPEEVKSLRRIGRLW
jgi:hypothetical protein